MKKLVFLIVLLSVCAFGQTHTFPALDTNNTFTGLNTFTLPTTFGDVVINGVCTGTGCASGGGGYATIQNAGAAITQRAIINLIGALACVDNAGSVRSDCKLTANAAVANQYLTGIDGSGAFLRKQIDYGELSSVPSTFAAAAHNLLSATHGDTTAGTVARGDVVTGQGATPKWTRLPKGAANNVLKMDSSAVDVLWGTVAYSEVTSLPQLAQTFSPIGSNWLTGYNASNGLFSSSQPACADLSNDAPSCATDTTNATNISSGTLPTTRMPALTGDITSTVNTVATTLATTIANAHNFTGAITNCTVQGMPVVGSSCFATLASGYAALGATPCSSGNGHMLVVQGYTETLAANLVLNKSCTVIEFLGTATITQGAFQVTMPSGTNGVSIISPYIHSSTAAVNAGVTFSGYTGTGSSWAIGDSSGFVVNYYEKGLQRSLDTGPAGVNAVAVTYTNVVNSAIDYPWCTGSNVNGHICYQTNGTGAFFAGIMNVNGAECNYTSGTATGHFCFQGLGISNNINIYGGHANMGGSANGQVCVDVNGTAANGWAIFGFDCDVANTSLTVESTAVAAIYGWFRQDSGAVNTATFGTGSQGNHIITNVSTTVTDSGVAGTNSVEVPNRYSVNSRFWQIAAQNNAYFFNDLTGGAVSRIVFAPGAGGNSRFNANGVGGISYANFDSGDSGFGVCTGTGTAVNCGRFKSEAATAEKIIAIPNSNLVIPFNVSVASDFVTAANANLQTITGLSWIMPANTVRNQAFDCYLMYSQQAAAVAADAFGIQAASLAPTQINAQGRVQLTVGPPSTFNDGNLTALATTTATNIVAFTASAITTIFNAELHGMIENPSGIANTINIMVKTGTAADTMTVKRGSYCLVH